MKLTLTPSKLGVWLAVGFVAYAAWRSPDSSGAGMGEFIGHAWHLAGKVLSRFGQFVSGLAGR